MLGYKHISTELAAKFACGDSIQLGSFSAYRAQENDRADQLEGVQLHGQSKAITRTDDVGFQTLRRMGVFGPGQIDGVNISNATVVQTISDYLMFCVSSEPDWKRCRLRSETVIEIDLVRFSAALRDALPVLSPIYFGNVQYSKSTGDFSAGEFRLIDPFEKPFSLSWEKEIRVVFFGYMSSRRYVRLRVPAARHSMRIINPPREN